MSDWEKQFLGICSKTCKVAWGKYAKRYPTVAQVRLFKLVQTSNLRFCSNGRIRQFSIHPSPPNQSWHFGLQFLHSKFFEKKIIRQKFLGYLLIIYLLKSFFWAIQLTFRLSLKILFSLSSYKISFFVDFLIIFQVFFCFSLKQHKLSFKASFYAFFIWKSLPQ